MSTSIIMQKVGRFDTQDYCSYSFRTWAWFNCDSNPNLKKYKKLSTTIFYKFKRSLDVCIYGNVNRDTNMFRGSSRPDLQLRSEMMSQHAKWDSRFVLYVK